ncbi:hypothetical protein Ciccas_008253, partial [Cichlidogyrus casuarinus]
MSSSSSKNIIFYLKANYLEFAKENWIPVSLQLFENEREPHLCIKTLPLTADNSELFESVVQQFEDPTKYRLFTALCTLSKYKSCDIVTAKICGKEHFALKLVPENLLPIIKKHATLVCEDKEVVIRWNSELNNCINLKRNKPTIKTRDTSNRSSAIECLNSQDTLNLHTRGLPHDQDMREETLADFTDNEVYEPFSCNELIIATVERNQDFHKLGMDRSDCYLRLADDQLELLCAERQSLLHKFPYLFIRR